MPFQVHVATLTLLLSASPGPRGSAENPSASVLSTSAESRPARDASPACPGSAEFSGPPSARAVAQGYRFLESLFDESLDLLPEYAGASVYWLYHDNYLAAKLLEPRRPDLAQRLRAAVRRHGARASGKIEILFDEAPDPLPFRQFELRTVTRIGPKTIRTEILKPDPLVGWESYADLLLMASRATAHTQPAAARAHLESALRLWDGHGFDDPARRTLGRYSTYKLALALIAARHLGRDLPMREPILARLERQQADSGGWITDYDAAGRPVGVANVETTCLVLLALDPRPRP